MDLGPHLAPQRGVEVRERLVEQEDRRPRRDGAGQGHPLALPAGQGRRLRRPPARRDRRGRARRRSRASDGAGIRGSPNPTLPATVRCGKRAQSWNTMPTRRASGGTNRPGPGELPSADGRPSRRRATSRPAMIRSSVVLPQPLGPSSARVRAVRHAERHVDEHRLVRPRMPCGSPSTTQSAVSPGTGAGVEVHRLSGSPARTSSAGPSSAGPVRGAGSGTGRRRGSTARPRAASRGGRRRCRARRWAAGRTRAPAGSPDRPPWPRRRRPGVARPGPRSGSLVVGIGQLREPVAQLAPDHDPLEALDQARHRRGAARDSGDTSAG